MKAGKLVFFSGNQQEMFKGKVLNKNIFKVEQKI